jgi:hypothetical protein
MWHAMTILQVSSFVVVIIIVKSFIVLVSGKVQFTNNLNEIIGQIMGYATLSITTLIIMTLCITTLSITTTSIMNL